MGSASWACCQSLVVIHGNLWTILHHGSKTCRSQLYVSMGLVGPFKSGLLHCSHYCCSDSDVMCPRYQAHTWARTPSTRHPHQCWPSLPSSIVESYNWQDWQPIAVTFGIQLCHSQDVGQGIIVSINVESQPIEVLMELLNHSPLKSEETPVCGLGNGSQPWSNSCWHRR